MDKDIENDLLKTFKQEVDKIPHIQEVKQLCDGMTNKHRKQLQ